MPATGQCGQEFPQTGALALNDLFDISQQSAIQILRLGLPPRGRRWSPPVNAAAVFISIS